MNPVQRLHQFGQSAWLDQLKRGWLHDGQLAAYVDDDGIRGVTSNPSIFEAAISGSDEYDEQLVELARQGRDAVEIYDALTIADIRGACDVFLPLYEDSGGTDGFVSHEVTPELAHDRARTIDEARRLWQAIGRKNAMIKVPATQAGVEAGQQCLTEGINVNFTLMFSMAHYDAVAEAYLKALEARVGAGEDVAHVASVASFFISRVDSQVDGMLEPLVAREDLPIDADRIGALRGTAAVANAKTTYRRYEELFHGNRFQPLGQKGARAQRVLWASTSTKNPAYSDVKYVDELVGPNTVNTIPLATMVAYRDHGAPRSVLSHELAEADAVVADLAKLGIDLNEVGQTLSDNGVDAFAKSMRQVIGSIEVRRAECV